MNSYNTTVLANGRTFQWRLRDGDYNRFKVVLNDNQIELVQQAKGHKLADHWHDDCGGEEFATISRVLAAN